MATKQPTFFQKGYKGKQAKPKTANVNTAKNTQWIEKYRPKNLNDVMSQNQVVSMLKNCINQVDRKTGQIELPNLLMYGPPGTGKTSTALALAKELFSQELLSDRLLELNASDDRGIQVVRTKIKDFAMRTVKLSGLKNDSGDRPPAAIKLIILDECDSMTRPAQDALRRTMEKYSTTTRFILIANYVTKIIGPIASRCAKLRFKNLDNDSKRDRLIRIAKTENVNISDDAILKILKISKGDLRKCVNFLQSAVNVVECDEENEFRTLESRHVEMISVLANEEIIEDAFDVALSCDFDKINKTVNDLLYSSYSCSDILSNLLTLTINTDKLSDLQKASILDKIGEIDGYLIDGADENIQLLNILTFVQLIVKSIA